MFGQPGRLGVCFGEWEERSPWPSLAEQRGYPRDDDVVTVHGGKGTFPIADINNDDPRDLLYLVAKSVAFPLSNKFLAPTAGNGETVVAVNPMWAQRFGRAFPDVDDLKAYLWEHAWQPIELWPEPNQAVLEEKDRVDANGRVYLSERPDQFVVVVCGGLGSLHAVALPELGRQRAGPPEGGLGRRLRLTPRHTDTLSIVDTRVTLWSMVPLDSAA